MLLDFLQSLEMRLLEQREQAKAPPSRIWTTKYKWFINPILQCPYCQDWLETWRVWVVDEDERKVRAVYDLDGGKEIKVSGCHPHVGTAGAICMGSARTPAEALFASLSNDAYVKPFEWLPDVLEHRCDEMDEAEDENYTYCRECEDRIHIDDAYYSEDTDGAYCSDCYWDNHWRCDSCDGEWHIESDECQSEVNGRIYCESCFSQRFFSCEGCYENFSHDDYGGDGRCQECYDELWEACRKCGEDSLRTDEALDPNGLCENCRPPAEEEEEDDVE